MCFKNLLRELAPRRIPASGLRATLLSYGFFDEMISGLPVVGLLLNDNRKCRWRQ